MPERPLHTECARVRVQSGARGIRRNHQQVDTPFIEGIFLTSNNPLLVINFSIKLGLMNLIFLYRYIMRVLFIIQ